MVYAYTRPRYQVSVYRSIDPLVLIFMPLTMKTCLCVCVCVEVRDIVSNLHIWIPHGKIADAYFWFSLNYPPL